MLVAISTIVATILCAILYRLGGLGPGPGKQRFPWLPKIAFNGKVRDWGVPLVCLGWLYLNKEPIWWQGMAMWGLMWAALTTYWDDLFDYDNFYCHGFFVGLAMMICWSTVGIWWALARAILVGAMMGILCDNTENDDVEELGRGGIIAITLPLLLF